MKAHPCPPPGPNELREWVGLQRDQAGRSGPRGSQEGEALWPAARSGAGAEPAMGCPRLPSPPPWPPWQKRGCSEIGA